MAKNQKLEFYQLVELLVKIAAQVDVTVRLMQEGQSLRDEKQKTKDKNILLQNYWRRHEDTPEEQAGKMARELARLIKPRPNVDDLEVLPDEIDE